MSTGADFFVFTPSQASLRPRLYRRAALAGRRDMGLKEELEELRDDTLDKIENAQSSDALEEVRIAVLGKKGSLTAALRSMRELPKEERPVIGKVTNEVRDAVEAALEAKKQQLKAAELEEQMAAGAIDVTLPGRSMPIGTEHLINHIIREVSDIFAGIGYEIIPGREVETDFYNFTALNAPADHPSRSMQDTFYVLDRSGDVANVRGESDVLLRTQTSGTQVHTMEEEEPPIYMISPGKVLPKHRPHALSTGRAIPGRPI